ncbi:hypothetical protein CASFOL_037544 [Castilleja foliolosa]|uniref:Helitron helicase-like domain-containing protein n=1 Tax=Castilleja foliolosa TaxID=1961234 RepID=A0ABD3BMF7_9LAMI
MKNNSYDSNDPFKENSFRRVTNNSRLPGKHLGTQVQTQNINDLTPNNSFVDINDYNLVENSLTYGSDVPVGTIGLSKTVSSINTPQIFSGSVLSSNTPNNSSPFRNSPLSDITNVIDNDRRRGQLAGTPFQTQNLTDVPLQYSCIDLNDNNLVESTLTYGSNFPMDRSGLSKNTSSSVRSTTGNHGSENRNYFKNVVPLRTSPLSQITNVNYNARQPSQFRGAVLQTQNRTDLTPNNAFIDLTGKNLVENTLGYASDVPVEIVNNRAALETLHEVIVTSEQPKSHTKGRTKVTNPINGIATVIDKPKRSYIRRKTASNIIQPDCLPSSSSCQIENQVDAVGVTQKQPLPRKNISRRSRRFVLELCHDANVKDHPNLPSEYGDLGDASYECRFCRAAFWLDERCVSKGYKQSLLPEKGTTPKFAQMYIYDTENEVSNRKNSVRGSSGVNNLCEDIIVGLKNMLDANNKLVKTFRMAKDTIHENVDANVRLRLTGNRRNNMEERTRNLPTCSEVAVLVVGDSDNALGPRDIVVELRSGKLRRINELNISYLALQYPLLLPYGEDGFTEDIPLTSQNYTTTQARRNVSVREYYAFRLHDRKDEASTILSSRRLFQQFIVDAYTMVETCRLNFVYLNQKKFRVDIYKGLEDAVVRGYCDPKSRGKRIILPSTFNGIARFMIQNYQDAMAICRSVGYPDLFITFSCNPAWPEIYRFLDARNMRPEDRPDIVTRVFHLKLNDLIRELKQNQMFGKVIAVVYTIEFQKRGLPHAHILLFLSKENKYPTPDDIDRIISAEIPDKESDPTYNDAVKTHMMHGPCGMVGKYSPCMAEA